METVQLIPSPKSSTEALELFFKVRDAVLDHSGLQPPLLVLPPGIGRDETCCIEKRIRDASKNPLGKDLFEDAALIVQTSGSTSATPSLVSLSRNALIAGAKATETFLNPNNPTSSAKWVVALPLHHIAGLQMLVRAAISGTEPAFPAEWPTFSAARFAEQVCATSASLDRTGIGNRGRLYASLVSAQLHSVLSQGPTVVEAVSKLDAILLGGGRISPDLLKRARDLGLNVVTTYGMTETSGGCVYNGIPLANTKIRLEDETDRILISSSALMNGYLQEDSPWVQIGSTRYFRTSDVGHFGQDGELHVDGRVDDIINSGGIKISAAEVTSVLESHPNVSSAFCAGVPDEVWGQTLAALVVLEPKLEPETQSPSQDLNVLAQSLRTSVKEELSPAHMPRTVVITDKIPTTSLGKVSRSTATSMIQEAIRSGTAWRR